MTKVLVTGGAGFIGSAMVRHLCKEGFEVRAFDLSDTFKEYKTRLPEEAEVYRGSILDMNDLLNATEGCDNVVHLAAMLGVKKTETKRLECLNINILGTINVLEACVKDNVKKVLFSSSSEVYGEQREVPITEANPVNPKSVYAITKLAAEEYLRAYHKRYGLNFSIVRFFNVYGPDQVAEFVMPRFIKNVIEGRPPTIYGKGVQIRAFCYMDDAVKGATLALTIKKANTEVFNIGNSNEPISIRDLAFKIIKLSSKNLQPKVIPMEQSDRDEKREIHQRYPDISKARRVLGYEPEVELEEGILKIMEHGKISNSWADPTER
jgi:UDP-glucose 4-epimerase